VTRQNTDQPDANDMLRAITSWILERVSGVRIGQVLTYDVTQRTAVVQPVRRRKIFGTPEALKTITAPVCWWRFAGLVLAGEVQAGDEVLLVTCEREIWPWYVSGQQHDPTSERMHDPSDSIALPWVSNVKRAITARVAGTFWMGREDASAGITITQGPAPGTITVEGTGPGSIALGSGATIPVALATPTEALFGQLYGAISGAAVVAGDGGASFKAAILASLASWVPGVDVAATKTVAE
jgi:hypothetical protein